MTDYNITKRIIQKSSWRSFLVLRPEMQFKYKRTGFSVRPISCMLSRFVYICWCLIGDGSSLKPVLISESCPDWSNQILQHLNSQYRDDTSHLLRLSLNTSLSQYCSLHPGALKYFLLGNIWDANTLKYLTYLLYEIQFHVIWVTSLSPPNNFKFWGIFWIKNIPI